MAEGFPGEEVLPDGFTSDGVAVTAHVYEDGAGTDQSYTFYVRCEPCYWEAGIFYSEASAERSASRHNEECPYPEPPDERSHRQKFQDALDAAYQNAKGSIA